MLISTAPTVFGIRTRPLAFSDRCSGAIGTLPAVLVGSSILILDAADADSHATIGFDSDHCDRDYGVVVKRGPVALDPRSNKAWGARTAYLQGPGRLKFEIEGPPK